MNNINIVINKESIINEKFVGFGGNLWSGCLSDEGVERLGMSEAYFEINAKRIMCVKPKLIRYMIMPHYFVDYSDGVKGEKNWKSGIYNFDSDHMHNFWRYCEVFKAAGTKVEINFGGAVSTKIPWFGIADMVGVAGLGNSRSAPDDLEAFALAAATLIEECHKRGYGNTIGYINFYNESNWQNFGAFGDKRIYWRNMVKLVHYALVKKGLRDKIIVIGTDGLAAAPVFEDNISYKDWQDNMYEYGFKKGYCDTLSSHLYYGNIKKHSRTPEDIMIHCKSFVKRYPDLKVPPMITEYGRKTSQITGLEGGDGRYENSLVGSAIAHANSGISASAYWFFCGTLIPSPLVSLQNGALQLWDCPAKKETGKRHGVESVNSTFGEMGLVMRYVPTNCKVVETSKNSDDIRVAAFVKDEDITIVAEVNRATENRKINIDLGFGVRKKIYKHIYTYPSDDEMVGSEADAQFDGNAILPEGVEIGLSAGQLNDAVGMGHYLLVYTTLENAKQILLEKTEISITKNQSADINVIGVIGLESNEVEYSIMNDYNTDGTLKAAEGTLKNNTYIPDTNAQIGDTIAIKVSSTAKNADKNNLSERYNSDSYAVAIINII